MSRIERTFRGVLSNEDVFAWLDKALEANTQHVAKGIQVSNSLHERGISGEYKGIKIAANPDLWPDDQVRVVFDDDAT